MCRAVAIVCFCTKSRRFAGIRHEIKNILAHNYIIGGFPFEKAS
ncbi:hypothetical protein CLOLEP_01247 [[Clostridium] leptum DSM 753]|uniref:Uncharacterized protein n=1 Tax=[Clostridium] leptum DSM 753 TaxID=428125 RepID=A7VRR3_9FIRM|nr:hypothetical protein CLOLEP_01247 [[Clostridium] leptum DSM 753]